VAQKVEDGVTPKNTMERETDMSKCPIPTQIFRELCSRMTSQKPLDIFTHFKEPWFFLETADEYRELFEKCGLRVALSEIESVRTKHTPEEVFNRFSSAAVMLVFNRILLVAIK
jgi:hypothetical protein